MPDWAGTRRVRGCRRSARRRGDDDVREASMISIPPVMQRPFTATMMGLRHWAMAVPGSSSRTAQRLGALSAPVSLARGERAIAFPVKTIAPTPLLASKSLTAEPVRLHQFAEIARRAKSAWFSVRIAYPPVMVTRSCRAVVLMVPRSVGSGRSSACGSGGGTSSIPGTGSARDAVPTSRTTRGFAASGARDSDVG